MIYSRWRADGGYDYFRTSERYGLGDDLPTPSLQPVNAIGVPSTSVGRKLPSSAQWIGTGTLARGSVTPLDRRGLSLGALSASAGNLALLTAAALFGWWLRGQLAREIVR